MCLKEMYTFSDFPITNVLNYNLNNLLEVGDGTKHSDNLFSV